MRLSVLFALAFIALQNPAPPPGKVGKPQLKQSTTANQTAASDQRGTDQSPLVVKTIPSPKTKEEADQDAKDRQEKSANDRHIIYLTAALATIAFGQLCVYWYQATKLKETVESYEAQSSSMERHIGEATRSANAMEEISKRIQEGNRAILRAYLTVITGTLSLFQERREPGQPDLKFETRPHLTNTGNTAARNVNIRIAADILPLPIPETFQFPLPEEREIKNAGVVGAHQMSVLAGTVKDFVLDAEVGAIKEGRTKALCTWGVITYEDIFGAKHWTKFGQIIQWNPNGTTVGYYIAGQNDTD